jgi:hypothetical protein
MAKGLFEQWNGADFPDLKKALLGKSLEKLLTEIPKGESIFEPANKEKKRLEQQHRGNFIAMVRSQAVAVAAGNSNSCLDKKQFGAAAAQQQTYAAKVTKKATLPSYGQRRVTKKLPKRRGVAPVRNAAGKQPAAPSISRAAFGGLNSQTASEYKVATVKPQQLDGKRNFTNYVRSQAGYPGKSIDRAIGYTHDGTPQYGDDEINQANQDNVSANLANTPPTLDIPKTVAPGATIDANKIERKQPAQTQPKGDSAGNILVLGAVAVGVTAILFLLRDIIGVASFVINVSTVVSTVTNLAQSFVAIFDNIAALLGLSEGLSKPINETFDSILNNVFGKEKVDYVKYNFARINAVFTAASNVYGRIRSTSRALADGIEEGANNTSRIGNALRRAGVLDDKLTKMDEQIAINVDKSQLKTLNNKLSKVSNVNSELQGITSDVKSSSDELKQLDKDRTEKLKEEAEKKAETDKKEEAVTGKPIEIPNISSRGV